MKRKTEAVRKRGRKGETFLGVEHIGLAARDAALLSAWYCTALGFRPRASVDNGPGQPKTWFLESGDGFLLEIYPADPQELAQERPNLRPGLAHLAIGVSDFDAADKRLVEAGARVEGEARAAPFGARIRFYRDPEGNLFHIVWRPRPLPDEGGKVP